MTINYVKPFTSERASPCSDVQRPCLTLNEYASNSDEYFVNYVGGAIMSSDSNITFSGTKYFEGNVAND